MNTQTRAFTRNAHYAYYTINMALNLIRLQVVGVIHTVGQNTTKKKEIEMPRCLYWTFQRKSQSFVAIFPSRIAMHSAHTRVAWMGVRSLCKHIEIRTCDMLIHPKRSLTANRKYVFTNSTREKGKKIPTADEGEGEWGWVSTNCDSTLMMK